MIDVNLFAHILLDPELQGRFGLQGNAFTNTIGFLNAYLEFIDLNELSEENKKSLKALSSATQQLIRHAKHTTTREDQYYPIQSYLLPQPINQHESILGII